MKKVILSLVMLMGLTNVQAQYGLQIQGAYFEVNCNSTNKTAEIVDYEYEVEDREFPMKKPKRKFKNFGNKSRKIVEIPSNFSVNGENYTITSIGKAAFAGYTNVDHIVIPNTIERIDDYAFFRCSAVSVKVPGSVSYIGDRAFGWCSNLKSLEMPGSASVGKGLYTESKACKVIYVEMTDQPLLAKNQKDADDGYNPSVSSDVDIHIPTTIPNNDVTFAVIIANENYQNESTVNYALNDGRMFKNYCRNVLGIPDENIHLCEDATLNNMQAEIRWMENLSKAYDGSARFILYYAGHGIPDEASGISYLLPVDGIGDNTATGYSLKNLYNKLGKLSDHCVTVFMDACFSGSVRGDGMLASSRGVAIKASSEKPIGNMVVFSAAQGDETAYPYKEKGHGLFTYFLLKKLQETKGEVNLGELSDYLRKQVSRRAIVVNNKPQTPTTTYSINLNDSWRNLKLR